MTALLKFERLEAPGVWKKTPSSPLVDVVVAVGDATMVLTDPRTDKPLVHWSLPAVTRLNPGQHPAIFAPGGTDSPEIVEIEDELMIEAIEKVHTAIEARRPKPGRLRGILLAFVVIGATAAAAAWVPDAVVAHAARIAQPAQREAIGNQILMQIERDTGPACDRPAGAVVLERLSQRLTNGQTRLVVLPATMGGARALPGNIVVFGNDLLANQISPDVAAGHVLAAVSAAAHQDPLRAAVEWAGFRASISMLTTGELPAASLSGFGRRVAMSPLPRAPTDELLSDMRVHGISSEPYARSLDPSGESVLELIESDPFSAEPPAKPILSPGEWSQLQKICRD
ncbi:MAG: hypothetical protein DI498_07570 [Paracoccus denitrificans]|nr:MAG: hypothetical protein DI498_07570 [Paracoccus denitrificans]PZO84388.1 MAG: hypothetical protein DI633_07570 [Paracoccus denitrificans]